MPLSKQKVHTHTHTLTRDAKEAERVNEKYSQRLSVIEREIEKRKRKSSGTIRFSVFYGRDQSISLIRI